MRYALLIIALLGCTPPPAEIAPEPAPLVLRQAHEMTADEFVEAAFGYTESECTIDEFYAEFGTAKQNGSAVATEGTDELWWVQYACRDRSVILYLDSERWDAGYVEIVDVERE